MKSCGSSTTPLSNCKYQFAAELLWRGRCVHNVASWFLILYLKYLSIFLSLPLSSPCSLFFLFPSSSPSLQSALDHMVMEGHSSTANTNLQLSFIATVVSWVWKQENQIARKPGKSVSGKSGEQVCGSVNSCFFLPFLMINNLNDFFFLYSYWSEVWEGKKKCLVYLKS